ncbi:hypothetical protein C7U61_02425 [Rhizobium sp. JAB6]|uniref:PriCT-2 domain-containing protein n=1 Tax=Rhizobium sp. JAB6 TaxID=2127050 RepID=UPI000D13BCD8|nr:PriCT-2 domain-containing protein [Rhizobium sp. JAB6]PST23399.1 hypothetical protein C7U61_02425 [Rhizobium sp. JAB6]
MDKKENIRFLKYLTHKNDRGDYVPSPTYLFQPYPEKGKGTSLYAPVWGSLATRQSTLEKAQDEYSAIGVTVNIIPEGMARKDENVTGYRAVWHDDDGKGFKGEVALEPTLIVETSPDRFHRYWFIDRSKGDITAEQWTGIMDVMHQVYGSDKGHPCQAMRLPGSYHQKLRPEGSQGEGDRWTVKIVQETGYLYSAAELIEAFGTMAEWVDLFEQPGADKVKIPVDWKQDRDRIVRALKYVPAEDRLDWFKIGGAIYDACGGAIEGFRIWDDWCQTSEKHDPTTQLEYWNKEFPKRENTANRAGLGTIFRDAIEAGANPDEVYLLQSEDDWTPPSGFVDLTSTAVTLVDPFAKDTINALRVVFDSRKHYPSDVQLLGLENIATSFVHMAVGVAGPSFFLSSLPCGVGKTTTVIESTKQLMKRPDLSGAGVIYFLARVEEIKNLVREMNLSPEMYAVLVSKGKAEILTNAGVSLGNQNIDEARILFTTQQQLEVRTKGGDKFEEIDRFFYRGKPRKVRVWDETITPSMALTLARSKLGVISTRLSDNKHHGLAEEILQWQTTLKGAKTGDVVSVPEVSSVVLDLQEFREMFGEEDRTNAEALWRLSGRQARVRTENNPGEAWSVITLDYHDNLPKDLAPMLILDASGSLRQTYRFWAEYRQSLGERLVFLVSPEKTYRNLIIHRWDVAAGKTASRDHKQARDIAEAVAREVRTLPAGEKVLFVHFKRQRIKGGWGPDMEQLIRDEFVFDTKTVDRLNFLTWGNHAATNDYADVKNVFLIGVLQYNEAAYEADGRGAKKMGVTDDFLDTDLNSIRMGEIGHNILQAANRGSMRKSVGDDCPEGCRLYIIGSENKGTGFPRHDLRKVFPGAEIVDWNPIPKKLSRKAQAIIEQVKYALQHFEWIDAKAISDDLGMDKGNFSRC